MKSNQDRIKHETEYVTFLEKRLASKNFHNNSTVEEIETTKVKLKKAKLVLRMLVN